MLFSYYEMEPFQTFRKQRFSKSRKSGNSIRNMGAYAPTAGKVFRNRVLLLLGIITTNSRTNGTGATATYTADQVRPSG
jgi:hypothetical protein